MFLEENKLIPLNHLGGIKGRSSDHVVILLHQKLIQLKNLGYNTATVALDQSIFYDIINHDLLFAKLKHLNFGDDIINILKSYLANRKQATTVNSNTSKTIQLDNVSVAQGSILSGTLAMLFSLDMHAITHSKIHSNNKEYFTCKNPKSIVFVDDIYTILQTKDNNILDHIEKYIIKMESYYNSNGLVMNIKQHRS